MIPTAQALADIAAVLDAAGIAEPRREARLILSHAIGTDPATLFARETVPPAAGIALAHRRACHEPLAYITGRREFWSLDLAVTPAALIPRPDSETLIEAALRHSPDRNRIKTILDLGTGSGALLLAALTEFPAAFGIGTDCIPQAAGLARSNAGRLGLADRCGFVTCGWASAFAAKFDLILANPPYIPSAAIAGLMPDVACYEPVIALDGGPDGLDAYREIIADLPRLLTRAGIAILEAGAGQAAAIIALAARSGLTATSHADLAEVPRAIVMTVPEGKGEKIVW